MQLPENHFGPWRVPGYAKKWDVCPATVYNWIAGGLLESVKINGIRRILPEHDHKFVERIKADQGNA